MRAYLPDVDAISAKNLKDALEILSKENRGENKAIRLFAGGTDMMVSFAAGYLKGGKVLNIWGLKELKKIAAHPKYIEIGALVTYTDIRENRFLQKNFPNLCKAAALTGAIAIQNRGTIGGNIANASPAADTPPVLLTYDANIVLASVRGERVIAYHDFHLAYKKTRMEPDELIKCVRLPKRTGDWKDFYRKVGARKAQAVSKVCLSASFKLNGEKPGSQKFDAVRIGLGAVAPIPLRCLKTEGYLAGKKPTQAVILEAAGILMREISPIDDIRSTKNYRTAVAVGVFKRVTAGFL